MDLKEGSSQVEKTNAVQSPAHSQQKTMNYDHLDLEAAQAHLKKYLMT